MTGPSRQNVLAAARQKLIASDYFSPLIGTDVGKDATGKAFSDAWVFEGTDNASKPRRDPANTGTSAVVMSLRTPWSPPNISNTARFRLLQFCIYSDGTRGADKSLTGTLDASDRCDRIASAIIREFNDVGNVDHIWPNDTYIVSCVLYNDLNITDVDNQDGLKSGDLSFALTLG